MVLRISQALSLAASLFVQDMGENPMAIVAPCTAGRVGCCVIEVQAILANHTGVRWNFSGEASQRTKISGTSTHER